MFWVYAVHEEAEAGDSKTLKISVTVYQPTQNCINTDQLEKDIQGAWYVSLKGWLNHLSYHVMLFTSFYL